MSKDLHLLIDYYNLSLATRRRGLRFVIESVLQVVGTRQLDGIQNVHARLYAGWHKGTSLTRTAQSLTAEAQSNFPALVHVNEGKSSAVVKVNVTMVYSLAAMPGRDFHYTLRSNPLDDAISCRHQGDVGCLSEECPMTSVHQFINNDKCAHLECAFRIRDFITIDKQKLVDTMLTSDAIYHSTKGSRICIVSSDDDFWPAILHSISAGAIVIHVHTQAGNRISDQYSAHLSASYVRKTL